MSFKLTNSNTLLIDPNTLVYVAMVDGGGNQTGSSANPLPVTVVDAVATGTAQYGQAQIATTGTAVQLSSTSYVLQNGIVLTNNGMTSITVGSAAVTNTMNGTGNGYILVSGASTGIPSGINMNALYINGTIGAVVSWEGN
jgi:hypothetical protein